MKEASIAVICQKKQILLIKRRDVPIWVLPGGGIEEHETPEQAICREVWEETGLRVKVIRKIAEYFPINRLAKKTFLFECQEVDGCLRTGCETAEAGYYSLSSLPQNLFILHSDWLRDALKNEPEVINKPIEVTYFRVFKYFCLHPRQVILFLTKKFIGS